MAEVDPVAFALTEEFLQDHPGEVANIVETWPTEDVVELFEQEPKNAATSALVVEHLTPDTAAHVLDQITPEDGLAIVSRLDPGRSAGLVARLSGARRDWYLDRLQPGLATEIRELMAYPPDCAGSLMDVHATTVGTALPAAQVLERVRAGGRRDDDIVVVDTDHRLRGMLSIDRVALAPPQSAVGDLIDSPPAFIQALSPREDVVELLAQSRLSSLPVVDAHERVVGIIRHSALVKAAEEEASADIQTMVGVSAAERALSPVRFAVSKRLPWLQINLLTAFLAAAVVGVFEATIARFTALAVLLPVVAGQSGNTGAQALAVTMRGLVLREIRLRHWNRVLVKEGVVAFINGVGVAVTTSLAVWVWSQSIGLASVIGLSMVISMVCAGLAGAAVPITLVAARQDPAQSSSIILTTITDVVGFFSFLGIATLLAGSL